MGIAKVLINQPKPDSITVGIMVVNILMTYIGLNGILKSQLKALNLKNEFSKTTSVNYTSLQLGYIIFIGYVAFAFILSYLLKKTTCANVAK